MKTIVVHPFPSPRLLALKVLSAAAWLVTAAAGLSAPAAAPANPPKQLRFSNPPTQQEIFQARVFEEPLVPIGGQPSAAQNADLAAALAAHARRTNLNDCTSVTDYLEKHPRSPWRAALLTGLGLEYYKSARYSRALSAWEEAWRIGGKQATDAEGRLLADRALCELAGLYSRLGRMPELELLLKSLKGRLLVGGAVERISLASEALDMMKHRPEISFRCGPLALLSIQRSQLPIQMVDAKPVFDSASTHQGFSLPQVAELSQRMGLNYQMAFRKKDGEFVVPSVVHWKVDHYAAVVRKMDDWYLLEDPTFGDSVWVTREALEEETSGYFLIPPGDLPAGWRHVPVAEGAKVWGKGITGSIDPDNYTPMDPMVGVCTAEDGLGMAVSAVHATIVSLQLRDTPVGYQPPVGPAVRFTARYNQRDYRQTPSATTRVFGPRWTHDWEAYIADGNPGLSVNVKYMVGGGGARTFTQPDTNILTSAPQQMEQTQLTRTGPDSYEMVFPDGSRKIFGQRSSLNAGQIVLLTQVVDSAGNAVTLTWDDNRLMTITDAIGQVTTLSYEHPTNSTLITKVTDPFGRIATFGYGTYLVPMDHDMNPLTPHEPVPVTTLTSITDVLGLTTQFSYQVESGPQDSYDLSLVSMTTPYGTTSFAKNYGGIPGGTSRFVQTTYPDGSVDRVEFSHNTNGIAFSDPAGATPQGMNLFNQWLYARNTFYWDRNAYAQGLGDYSKARIFHWLHAPNLSVTSGILESTKEPLERRVWFTYAGQVAPYISVGNTDRPGQIGRVLDDGTTQLHTYAYNRFGHVTNAVDPVGRRFTRLYATNEIDLLEVRQTRGTNSELIWSATYNHQHRPLTVTDAAGQTTTNTYNARGQLLTTTNPKGETTSLAYDANGFLLSVDGPLPGVSDRMTFTHDSFNRLRAVTNSSGYYLVFDYDALDRRTRVTFPDGTYNENVYDRLDLVMSRDSAGRETLLQYDSMRQLIREIDPLGRVTQLAWCGCGKPEALTDPLGRTTHWVMDVQGRLTQRRYPDGSIIHYAYEPAGGRLRQIVDEKNQITQLNYYPDNALKSHVSLNAQHPTAPTLYEYDPDYPRLRSVTDGLGKTVYGYHPPGQLGALQLAAVDGPWTNDTLTFNYDALGRVTSRAIGGVAQGWTFDSLGRVAGVSNLLGSFGFAYEGDSTRLTALNYPNGQTSQWQYFPAAGDHRLQSITHRRPDTSVLAQFSYAYDIVGNITNWSQQSGAWNETWSATYDAADRLLGVVAPGSTNGVVQSFTYDAADNRLAATVDGNPTTATFNALNQQVSLSDAPTTNATYEWDGRQRLIAIVKGTNRSEFTYDDRDRLRQVIERQGNTITSERRFLWVGTQLAEERDANDAVVARFFELGESRSATNRFYFRDHLGSLRLVASTDATVHGEYAYSPYGIRSHLSGEPAPPFGFTGLLNHETSGLQFAIHRVYDPGSARWLSRDPIGENAGLNLYAYVRLNPLRWRDPLGLDIADWFSAEDWKRAEAGWNLYQATSTGIDLNLLFSGADDLAPSRWSRGWGAFNTGLDVIQSGLAVGKALRERTIDSISSAVVSCGETALAFALPPVGVPLKAIHWLNDQVGDGRANYEFMRNLHEGQEARARFAQEFIEAQRLKERAQQEELLRQNLELELIRNGYLSP